jgi:[ribosomal protein S5]-alanine N-acetyltransferase
MTHDTPPEVPHFPVLETERLMLREMSPQDVNELIKQFGNTEVIKFIGMQPIRSIEQANEWLRWMGGYFQAKDGLRWAIALKQGAGAFIGSAGIYNWNREANHAEISCDIMHPYWDNGYGTEAMRALIEFGWEHLKLNRVEVNIINGNQHTRNFLEKLGFKSEGVLRQRILKGGKYYDVHIFGLLRHEYR